MANFLFKKSYKLSNFKRIKYDHLWGSKGVFTTIRLFGKDPKYVFLNEHIFKLNKSLKKMHIPFSLTQNILFDLIPSNLRIKKYDHLILRLHIFAYGGSVSSWRRKRSTDF